MTPQEVQQHILESNTKWVSPTTLQEALDKKEIQIKAGTVRINTETGKIELPETYLQESAVELNEELSQDPKSRVKDADTPQPDPFMAYVKRVSAELASREQPDVSRDRRGKVVALREVKEDGSDHFTLAKAVTPGEFRAATTLREAKETGCSDNHLKLLNAVRY